MFAANFFFAQAAVDGEHGELDHVGGGALDHAVDDGAFGQRAAGGGWGGR